MRLIQSPFRYVWAVPAIAATCCLPLCGQESGADPASKSEFASPQLKQLDDLVGVWTVTETHFDARGNSVGAVQGTEEIAWILDKHVLRRVYTTRTESSAYHAIGTLTWNKATKSYRGVWYDDVSTTGPTMIEGNWSKDAGGFVMTLDAMTKDGTPVQYKVIEKSIDHDTREATTFRIQGGEVSKRMRVNYTRSIPCPSGQQRVMPLPVFDQGKLAPGEPGKKKRRK